MCYIYYSYAMMCNMIEDIMFFIAVCNHQNLRGMT